MFLSALTLLVPLAQEPAAPAPPEQILSLRCEGLDALFVDRKDAALLTALKMAGERLQELPGEIEEFQLPPGSLELITRLFSGGAHSLSVAVSGEPIPGMPLPFLVDLRLAQGSGDSAAQLTDDLAEFIGELGMPLTAPAAGGLWVLPVPVPMWMGASGEDFVLRVGSDAGVESSVPAGLLPADARPSYSGMLDYGLFMGEMLRVMEMAGESTDELDDMLAILETVGFDKLKYEWAAGSDAERQYLSMRMEGWAAQARALGLMPGHGLGQAFLRTIPADATWASAAAFDLDGLLTFYERMLAAYGVDLRELGLDPVAEFEQAFGLSLHDDVLAPLGGRFAIYASDTTGGGGIFSTVGILELEDRDTFLATWKRLEEAVNRLGVEQAEGHLRFESWNSDNVSFHTLAFPGLPIPLELTVATADRYVLLGLSPQSVYAALEQAAAPESSLLDNPGFRAQMKGDASDLVGLFWIDTPRLMRDGYGSLGLATSALANAMRSPRDKGRKPGILLPTFGELSRGAKPILGLSYALGDDYISEYRGDRSQLVNAAGLVGLFYNSPFVLAVALGTTAGAVAAEVESGGMVEVFGTPEEDFDSAEYEQVERDIEAILSAIDDYAINNGGQYPDSLEVLVTPDENGYTYLKETALPVDPWGQPYGYMPPREQGEYPFVYSPTLEGWVDGEDGFEGEEIEEVEPEEPEEHGEHEHHDD